MADQQYYDVNGNPVGGESEQKKYYDVNGVEFHADNAHHILQGTTPSVPKSGPTSARGTGYDPNQQGNVATRFVANSLPVIGSAEGPLGTGAGTMAKIALRNQWPAIFGEPTKSIGGMATETGSDLLFNNLIPAGIGKLGQKLGTGISNLIGRTFLKNLPGVRQGAAREMTDQILSHLEEPATGEYQPIKIKPGEPAQPLRKGKSYEPATQPEVQLNGPIKSNITDSQVIQNLVRGGMKGSEQTLNAAKILDELAGKSADTYKSAFGSPETYSAFKDAISEIHAQQTGHGVADSILKVSNNKLVWGLAALSPFAHLSGTGGTLAAIAGGTKILNSQLAKAMENPVTAILVVRALRTPASAPEAPLIAKVLQNVFKAGADVATVPEH